MVGWMDGWTDKWMDGRTDGWMHEWLEGCLHACTYVSIISYTYTFMCTYLIEFTTFTVPDCMDSKILKQGVDVFLTHATIEGSD